MKGVKGKEYSVISHNGRDIRVSYTDKKVYFETELESGGELITVGQAYNLNRENYTANELSDKMEKLLDHFVEYAEHIK